MTCIPISFAGGHGFVCGRFNPVTIKVHGRTWIYLDHDYLGPEFYDGWLAYEWGDAVSRTPFEAYKSYEAKLLAQQSHNPLDKRHTQIRRRSVRTRRLTNERLDYQLAGIRYQSLTWPSALDFPRNSTESETQHRDL